MPIQITGVVQQLKRVDLRGANRQEVVALLRTNQGKRAIVDLGSADQFPRLGLTTGDRIRVSGFPARIGDFAVLMATRAQVDGETVRIARAVPAWRNYPVAAQTRRVRGEIQAIKEVGIGDSERLHVLALLRTEEERHVVDLGPKANLRGLNLRRGDVITVDARNILADGRPVLIAFRLYTDNRMLNLNRPLGRGPQGEDRVFERQQTRAEIADWQNRRSQQADAALQRVTVYASDLEFEPGLIEVDPGEQVRLTLVNRGEHPHNIELHLPEGEVMLDQNVQPGNARTLVFRAPSEPGEYEFYCPVGNHHQRGMEGLLVVMEDETQANGTERR